MANTMTSATNYELTMWGRKYRLAKLDVLLRKALVSEKICQVNRTNEKYINSPYGSQPTATVQTLTGTYTPATFTITDDTLVVTDEVVVGEHVYGFESALNKFDFINNRLDEQANAVKTAIDKWNLNELCEGGNATYSTPAGGFTTAANVIPILSNLLSKVAGYETDYMGGGNRLYLVLENTDLPGLIQAFGAAGFNTADAWLKNGYIGNQMGIDFYIVRTGTFADATSSTASGTKTWTNAGHRVFGVKGAAMYAAPRGVEFNMFKRTGYTGWEISTEAYMGFKQWVSTQDLTVDVTIV